MTDKQLVAVYAVMITGWVLSIFVIVKFITPATSADHHANKLCSELYGPQVGAVWVDGTLMCQSQNGTISKIKKE
jgi:hypothetical protein